MDDLDLGATIKGQQPGQKVLNRYTLTRLLGRGGMGVVWLARDDELERDVALKFLPEVVALDAEAVADLKRETRRNLGLTHPHIVRIHDFVSDKRTAAIAMEYVDGATLAALKLERPGRIFPLAELRPWLAQLLEALAYAHAKAKVVHRDLKPANLMVDSAGDLKVTDFGIATSITDSVSRVSKQAGSSGTPVYMSPQQMMGEKAAVTDDIYSLGATLYELLTGKPPFYTGNIVTQVQGKIPPAIAVRRTELEVTGEPVPPEWEAAIAACLAKEAQDRPQGMPELAARLGLGAPRPEVGVRAPVEPVERKEPERPAAAPETTAPATFAVSLPAALVSGAWLAGLTELMLRTLYYTPEPSVTDCAVLAAWLFAAAFLATWLATGKVRLRESLLLGGLTTFAAVGALANPWLEQAYRPVLPIIGALVGAGIAWLYRRDGASLGKDLVRAAGLGAVWGAAGFLAGWAAARMGLIPSRIELRTALGAGVTLWLLHLQYGHSAIRQPGLSLPFAQRRHHPVAVSLGLAAVATGGLLLFWRRGSVYPVQWDTAAGIAENLVLVAWLAASFGTAALADQSGRRRRWLAPALAALVGLELVRHLWTTDSLLTTELQNFLARYLDPERWPQVLPGLVGLATVVAGALAFRRGAVKRLYAYDLGVVALACLAGWLAGEFPYAAPSWEAKAAFPLWAASLTPAIVAFAWLQVRPALVRAMAAPAGK